MAEQEVVEVRPVSAVEKTMQLVDWGQLEVELFDINPENIGEELQKQPALLAFWSVRLADAETLLQESKYALEQAEAAAWVRVKAKLRGEEMQEERGRVTEADVKAEVAQDSEVRSAQEDLMQDEYRQRQYRAVVRALDQKGIMMCSRIKLLTAELEATMQKRRLNAVRPKQH